MKYTVWFDSGKGDDYWGSFRSFAKANEHARHLLKDPNVKSVTITIKNS